ncbi:hypothetical protein D3C86_918700 [compost metagenome]
MVEAHIGLVLAPLPDQGVAVDEVGTGPRHAEGGGEGLGTAAEDLVLARDYGHGAIRVIAEDDLHVGAGQVGQIAVARDEVDAALHLGQRHHPGRAEAVRIGWNIRLAVPIVIAGNLGLIDGAAGIVVPQVQAVAGEGPCDTARRAALGIHQGDHGLIGTGHQQLGRGLDVGKTSDRLILRGGGRSRRTVVVTA